MGRFTLTRSVRTRLLANVQVYPDGCWFWKGPKTPGGYGVMFAHGRQQVAHRVAYELFRGPIPDGLVLDHLCGHPPCVNPDHLDAVTERVNILRSSGVGALNARKTHCPKGHAYDAENTLTGAKGKYRRCRICVRERWHVKQKPQREAKNRARIEAGITPTAISPRTGKLLLGAPALWSMTTHCPQGHPYVEDNIIRTSTGGRGCRTCSRERYAKEAAAREATWQQRLGLDRPATYWEKQLTGNAPTAIHARATHCPRGHAYDEANTYLYRGKRYCRACHVENERARRARKGAIIAKNAS